MEPEILTTQEQSRLMRLLELIRSANRLINLYKDDTDESSQFSLRQYQDLKAEYLEELETLMTPFGIHIQQQAA